MLALAGEILLDLLLEGPGWRFQGVLGGSVLNTATTLARLGLRVRLLSETGSDWVAGRAEEELRGRNLDLRLLRHPEAFPLAMVELKGGEPSYAFHRPFRAPYRPGPQDLEGVKALHFGSLFALDPRTAPGVEALLAEARAQGAFLSYDPNLRPPLGPEERARALGYLEGVDLLKLSLEDARLLFPDPLEGVKALPPPLKVLTLGPEGALAFFQGETLRAEGLKVQVADTVGAGDAFTAGLLAFLERRGRLKPGLPGLGPEEALEALQAGVELSALACTVRGAYLPEEGLRAWASRHLGG